MTDSAKKYAVVEFEEIINNKKVVELVPIGWLSDNNCMCLWPPRNAEHKVPKWVELGCGPYEMWKKYPVKVLSKAKDYAQGLRRLKKSFKTVDVESAESESQVADKDGEISIFNSSTVSRLSAQSRPLTNQNQNSMVDLLAIDEMDINEGRGTERDEEAVFNTTTEPQGFENYNDVAKYLQGVIHDEMNKLRTSVNYHIGQQFKKMLEVVQYSADPPRKQNAWKNIGDDLPFDDLEKFIAFDESLKINDEKRNALTDIFQMVSAGCTKFEDDVYKIMEKLLKKDVQLHYSGCGRKIKGVGKKSFKETETSSEMEKFLTAKYHESKEKIKILTAVSTYLSGAKDRKGGRAQRK